MRNRKFDSKNEQTAPSQTSDDHKPKPEKLSLVQYWYRLYIVSIGLYMLEPWERWLFRILFLSVSGGVMMVAVTVWLVFNQNGLAHAKTLTKRE
jgi:hypothetical protein